MGLAGRCRRAGSHARRAPASHLDCERERWRILKAECDSLALSGAYALDTSQPGESNLLWIFTDKHALDKVRFDRFMADCRAIERPVEELEAAAAVEVESVNQFVAEQHQDLLVSFDPNIVRLRKRLKIFMHPRAFDDLADVDGE